MNQETVKDLTRIWDRLRILALTLQHTPLEDGDVKEIGAMIEDLLIAEFNPAIESLKEKGE